jgi:hypothetical protein
MYELKCHLLSCCFVKVNLRYLLRSIYDICWGQSTIFVEVNLRYLLRSIYDICWGQSTIFVEVNAIGFFHWATNINFCCFLYCVVLCCIVLYCAVLCCIVLYCVACLSLFYVLCLVLPLSLYYLLLATYSGFSNVYSTSQKNRSSIYSL